MTHAHLIASAILAAVIAIAAAQVISRASTALDNALKAPIVHKTYTLSRGGSHSSGSHHYHCEYCG